MIEDVSPAFSKAMASLGLVDSDWFPLIGRATVDDHGDVALPCHSLSRKLGKPPQDIADDVCEMVSEAIEGMAEATSTNGFVNIIANPSWLSNRTSQLISDTRFGVGLEDLSLIHI